MDPRVLLEPLDRLPDPLPIPVVARPFDASVRPPGSKSLTNRALLLAALAEGESTLHGALTEADDARVMIRALEQLGAIVSVPGDGDGGVVRVHGVGGRWRVPEGGVTLHLENAGTATRFLTGAALLGGQGTGPITIDGNARMRQRPIAELVDLLRRLGARAEYAGQEGFPPVRVFPQSFDERTPLSLSVGATASSQFVSALLLAAPFFPAGLVLNFSETPTSSSYVEMSVALMQRLGVRCAARSLSCVRVFPTRLYRFDYEVEPDASGATYFWAAAALAPGSSCIVEGLGEESLQGDAGFVEELQRMGAGVSPTVAGIRVCAPQASLAPIMTDLTLMPDAAMTLAATCCFAPGRSTIWGLRTLRVKETDRIAALENELRKVGAGVTAAVLPEDVEAGVPANEGLRIDTPAGGIDCSPDAARVEFDTYDDHRMAMSMALIGLRRPNVFIRNPGCVAKTYPTFWRDLARLYGVG